MRAIADNGVTHLYIYDAAGERVIKNTGDGQAIYINGFPMGGSGTVGNYTMYVNPFMVVSNFKYTKHFYIEGQRIVSKLGEMGIEQPLLLPKSHAGDSLKNPVKWDIKKDLTKDIIIANFEALGLNGAVFTAGKSGKLPYGQIKKYFRGNDVVINPGTPSTTTTSKRTEDLQFYYHPDHLGSSNYITDASGEVYQHQEYFPFGETFVEERNDAEYTTYLFNGKELDEETGLYYYGARYYDPKINLWQSIDPLSEQYPNLSPYNFVGNNPLILLDKDGRKIFIYYDGGKYEYGSKMNIPDNDFVKSTIRTLDKLSQLDESGIIKGLSDRKEEFKIEETVLFDRYSDYDKTVLWDPKCAIMTQGENFQIAKISPALALYHELGHAALKYLKKEVGRAEIRKLKREFNALDEDERKMYSNDKEEYVNIRLLERKMVKKLNLVPRNQHNIGEVYKTNDTFSTDKNGEYSKEEKEGGK